MFEYSTWIIMSIGFCLTMYGIYYAYNAKNRWSVFIPFILGLTLIGFGVIQEALNKREITSRVEKTSELIRKEDKLESKLLKAITVLEEAGFRVDRAFEEDARDAGLTFSGEANLQHLKIITEKTGAIVIRCTPVDN